MTPGDLELLAEAEAAGRDVSVMHDAEELIRLAEQRLEVGCTHKHKTPEARQKCWEKLAAGPMQARQRAISQWTKLCAESRRERRAARLVLAAWAKDDRARERLESKIVVRVNGRMAWHPRGSGRTVHWEALVLRRWIRILGLRQEYEYRMKKKGDDDGG